MIKTDKPQEFSAEDIDVFEAKYKSRGKVERVRFPSDVDPEVPATFWIARPGRQQLEAVAETAEKKGMGAANDLLLNTCILAGDVAQLEDDDALYFGVVKAIAELSEAKKKI